LAELGTTLFVRSCRSVELTAEGALVLDDARRVTSELDGLRDELEGGVDQTRTRSGRRHVRRRRSSVKDRRAEHRRFGIVAPASQA
jgi:DNA-binding transcriptional LysR family regulator